MRSTPPTRGPHQSRLPACVRRSLNCTAPRGHGRVGDRAAHLISCHRGGCGLAPGTAPDAQGGLGRTAEPGPRQCRLSSCAGLSPSRPTSARSLRLGGQGQGQAPPASELSTCHGQSNSRDVTIGKTQKQWGHLGSWRSQLSSVHSVGDRVVAGGPDTHVADTG